MTFREDFFMTIDQFNFRISYFAQNSDVQTAALLCCAFGRHCPPMNDLSRTSSLSGKSINQSVSSIGLAYADFVVQ